MAKRKTKSKRKSKNPFVNYSEEEIKAAEEATFIIQAGYDVYDVDGAFAFMEKDARYFHGQILKQVADQLNNGNRAERKNAKRLLLNLRIMPLRIH